MKITANFCTYSKRKDCIDDAVASIIDQVHQVRVYYNDYVPQERPWRQIIGPDMTDRGKFMAIGPDEIAFSLDDDLYYPPDYVETTIGYLEQHGGIVSYHGRKLRGKGLRYYSGHECHHFKFQRGRPKKIDVPGTGVMAFFSNEFQFNPQSYSQNKMVDVLVGLEAAKQGVPVTVLKHKMDWIRPMVRDEAIYKEMRGKDSVQSKLCDRIWGIKN